MVFAFREAEASAELLHPQNAGFGRAEHHDRVEGGKVDASLKMSTAKTTSISPSRSFSSERARGAPVDPVWTFALRMPFCRKNSVMKSA